MASALTGLLSAWSGCGIDDLSMPLPGFQGCNTFFLRSTPNLATVIPAMDHIDEVLVTQSQDFSLEPSIRVAITIAKSTLNSYYDKTDYSEVYQIAMSSSC